MNNAEAKRVLLYMNTEISVDQLFNGSNFVHAHAKNIREMCLDGHFSPQELEAIAAWARDPYGVTNAVIDDEETK